MLKKAHSSVKICLARAKYVPFYLISILPMRLLFILSDITFMLVYHVVRYRRKVVFNNLKNSFPLKNEKERNKIAKAFYVHFCDIIFESLKSLTVSEKSIKKRLHIENSNLVQKYLNDNRDILFYAAHQGNWEWLIFLPLFFPYHSNTFYKPLKNKYFNELFQIIRGRFSVNCIESTKGYRSMVKEKERTTPSPTMYCIIGDQSPSRNNVMHWCLFLNQETAFSIGADKIAIKMNQVVLLPHFQKIKRGYYSLKFSVIEESPSKRNNNEIVVEYANRLENVILNSPELWLWSHRRWKLNRPS